MEKRIRKSIDSCKWSLRDDSGRGSEDQNADRNMGGFKGYTDEVADGRTLLGIGLEVTLVTLHLAVFCPCPETL